MLRSASKSHNLRRYLIPSILILVFIWLLIQTAWVSDDAFITFRSVENFIHGYGPVFNIGERVQTFTHPLWFLLQSGANFVIQRFGALNAWGQMYYVNLALSIFISILVALVVAFGIARSTRGAVLGLSIMVLSKAFVDYSTSGLENTLTNLILALFLLIYLRKPPALDRPPNPDVIPSASSGQALSRVRLRTSSEGSHRQSGLDPSSQSALLRMTTYQDSCFCT